MNTQKFHLTILMLIISSLLTNSSGYGQTLQVSEYYSRIADGLLGSGAVDTSLCIYQRAGLVGDSLVAHLNRHLDERIAYWKQRGYLAEQNANRAEATGDSISAISHRGTVEGCARAIATCSEQKAKIFDFHKQGLLNGRSQPSQSELNAWKWFLRIADKYPQVGSSPDITYTSICAELEQLGNPEQYSFAFEIISLWRDADMKRKAFEETQQVIDDTNRWIDETLKEMDRW